MSPRYHNTFSDDDLLDQTLICFTLNVSIITVLILIMFWHVHRHLHLIQDILKMCNYLFYLHFTVLLCILDGWWDQWSPWSACCCLTRTRTRRCHNLFTNVTVSGCPGKDLESQVCVGNTENHLNNAKHFES